MVKDLRYVIKRILIGVGIALVLGYLRGNFLIGVNAKEISSLWLPYENNVSVISNLDETVTFDTASGKWANWGYGVLRFNFSIIKVGGSSTAPLVVPNNVTVNNYVCDISSTSVGNSTFTGSTYSATCPMIMGSSGLGRLYIGFTGNQQNEQSTYRITLGGMFTFEQIESNSYDPSSTNNAINNQTQNDNTNTQNIINNNNTNTNSIISNQDSNTQDIINNQNSNSEKEIESQKVCTIYDTNSIIDDNNYLQTDGTFKSNRNFGVTDYISINSSSDLYAINNTPGSQGSYYCFYNINKELISCVNNSRVVINEKLSIPSNTSYVRFSIYKVSNVPQWKLCLNGNQAITYATNNNTNAINNVNDTLNDDSGGEVDSSWFDDFKDDSQSPVSDLLTMPLTLLQAYVNGFSATCRDMNLGQLLGTYLIIPCINIESYLGSELWSLIDMLFSLFMVYNIGMLCISIYEGITSLNDDMQFLYSPTHAGPGSTRVERNSDLY